MKNIKTNVYSAGTNMDGHWVLKWKSQRMKKPDYLYYKTEKEAKAAEEAMICLYKNYKTIEDTDTINQIICQQIRYKYIYSILGLILGLICILVGVALFLSGIVGSSDWTANVFGVESSITDAAPGVIIFIVGLFIVIITRFRAVIEKDGDRTTAKIMNQHH